MLRIACIERCDPDVRVNGKRARPPSSTISRAVGPGGSAGMLCCSHRPTQSPANPCRLGSFLRQPVPVQPLRDFADGSALQRRRGLHLTLQVVGDFDRRFHTTSLVLLCHSADGFNRAALCFR